MADISPEFRRMDDLEYGLLESGSVDALNEMRRRQGQGFRVQNDESIWRVQPNPGHSTYETYIKTLDPKTFADFNFIWNQFFRTETSKPLEHPSIRPVTRGLDVVPHLEKDPDFKYTDDLYDITTEHPKILVRYLDDLNAAVETVSHELRTGLWVASLRLGEVNAGPEINKIIRFGQLAHFTTTVDKPGDLRIEPVITLDDELTLLPDDAVLQGVAIKP